MITPSRFLSPLSPSHRSPLPSLTFQHQQQEHMAGKTTSSKGKSSGGKSNSSGKTIKSKSGEFPFETQHTLVQSRWCAE